MKILQRVLVFYSFILSLIISVILIISMINVFIIDVSTIVQILVCITGIAAFVFYLLNKHQISFILITLWWLPQTFYIWIKDYKTFKPMTYDDIVYDAVMILRFGFSNSFGDDLSRMNVFSINTLAIAGVVASMVIFFKLRSTTQETTKE